MAEHDDVDDFDPIDREDAVTRIQAQRTAQQIEARRFVSRRRDAYTRLFGGAPMQGDKEIVMDDLRRFCRGGQTPWHEDPRMHALLTGRNEVFQRIMQHTTLTLDDLYTLVSGEGGNV